MRERWRKRFNGLFGMLSAVGAALIAVQGIWWVFGTNLRILFAGVWHIRAHHVVWSGAATAVIATVGYFAARRYSSADKNVYQLLAQKVRREKLKRRLEGLGTVLGRSGFNPRYFFFFNYSEHWLARKVEDWLARVLRVLLWPLIIVNLVHLAQVGPHASASLLLTACGALLLFILSGMRMRNLLLTALFAVWFGYVFATEHGLQVDAHAAVVGACFLLWEAWCEWRRRISYPVATDRNDDEGDDPPEEPEPEPPTNPKPDAI